ncbi:hypothetical protein [Bowmanella denitrificans]|uniref:hypothetical protein n=1 Tax=Bowmanella denitrificans TaxID=366582 RepID=UPI001559B81B|nr:hypothetical protein [Bowmanella denitrificans]
MTTNLQCWQCGAALSGLLLPLSRREECSTCGADLHCCKCCEFFDNRHCNEPRAEPPNDKEKANFCDYFKPTDGAYQGGYRDKRAEAKAKLAALFGDDSQSPPENTDTKPDSEKTPAELAEEKLRKLLGDG